MCSTVKLQSRFLVSCPTYVVIRRILLDASAMAKGSLLCSMWNAKGLSDSPGVQACEWTVRLVDRAHLSIRGSVLAFSLRASSWKVFKEAIP